MTAANELFFKGRIFNCDGKKKTWIEISLSPGSHFKQKLERESQDLNLIYLERVQFDLFSTWRQARLVCDGS